MIEGLKVTVRADELRELCTNQARFHRERSEFYAGKVAALEGIPNSSGQGYSGQDPQQQMRAKLTEHDNAARELAFIGDHLKPGEDYLLAASDLARLGIVRRHSSF